MYTISRKNYHLDEMYYSVLQCTTVYDSFRWKCHPLQYKFVLEGVTFPAETVILQCTTVYNYSVLQCTTVWEAPAKDL
jgi:hypothetical protein